MENILGYIIDQCPAPTMVVYPDDGAAKSISQNKIQPMIELSPVLRGRYNELKSKVLEQRFTGMTLYLTGARVAQKLASKAIKNLFFDEVDKFTYALKDEGDVLALAEERIKTFRDHKIFKASTPTTKYGRIWQAMEHADVIKKPKVKCPHCGEFIELHFKYLKWTKTGTDVTDVRYVCNECGCVILEHQRMAMLKTVRWDVYKENRQRRERIAFWMNTFYSPFVTFEQIALKWLEAQDNPELLHNFINSWLGEPWVEARSELDQDAAKERETDNVRTLVPSWAQMITAGVDVQQQSLYYVIRAWGAQMTSQCIDYGQVLSFTDIEYIMNMEYKQQDGTPFIVGLCAVDSGDQTDDVYQFCMVNNEWAVSIKGSSGTMYSHYKISTVNKIGSTANGQRLIIVDTNKYKDMIAARLQRENGPGSFMLHKDTDDDYLNQLTSEHKILETGKWEKKSSRRGNHYLDAEVYAWLAADLMGVRKLTDEEPIPAAVPTPDIKPKQSWIGGNTL